jgi:hypothetical protein
MSEAATLRQAIEAATSPNFQSGAGFRQGGGTWVQISVSDLAILRDAAEKHLATLPEARSPTPSDRDANAICDRLDQIIDILKRRTG